MLALQPPLSTAIGLFMVVVVVAMVAWALQLMQSANDRRDFSLMLAGCMVCSAAVGLATVMVLTLTGPNRLGSRAVGFPQSVEEPGISLDSVKLPWDGSLDCLVDPSRCPDLRSS